MSFSNRLGDSKVRKGGSGHSSLPPDGVGLFLSAWMASRHAGVACIKKVTDEYGQTGD